MGANGIVSLNESVKGAVNGLFVGYCRVFSSAIRGGRTAPSHEVASCAYLLLVRTRSRQLEISSFLQLCDVRRYRVLKTITSVEIRHFKQNKGPGNRG